MKIKALLKPLVAVIFLSLSYANANAQTVRPSATPVAPTTATSSSSQSDSEYDLMQRAQMIAEIKQLRAVSAGQANQITELKGQVEIYQRLDEVQEARISDLKEALRLRSEAQDINVKMERLYDLRLADYKEENLRLRGENSKLRKSSDRRSLIMGIIGLTVGAFGF